MPNYDYECLKCKATFEAFQSMKDDAWEICPKEKCQKKTWGKGRVKRLLGTGAGLIFKGSGFYITDYRSEGYKASAKKEQGDSGKKEIAPAKPAESKSQESKPVETKKKKADS